MKFRLLHILALTGVIGIAPQLRAETGAAGPFSISVPDFLIPLGGQTGTLTLYADGRAPETTGFNALGRQRLTIAGNSSSSGTLTLNLVFPGFSLDNAAGTIGGTRFSSWLRDVDFMGDQIARGVTLIETAALTGINGLTLATPISLGSYLPQGTRITDNQLLALDPVQMDGSELLVNFAAPFTLTFTLTATVENHRPSAYTMNNLPESINSDLSAVLVPPTVPEPSTWALIGLSALLALTQVLRRRRG